MGIRGELFTTNISLDNRTYFFNVKENRNGDVFLQVVESKNTEGTGFDRHAIVIFEEDMQKFLQGLESSLQYIEKNRKKTVKKTIDKKDFTKRPRENKEQTDNKEKPRTDIKPTGKVRVITKKNK